MEVTGWRYISAGYPRALTGVPLPSVRDGGVQITIDTRDMVAHINRVFAAFPKQADRALRRATTRFRAVLRRQALQATSESTGIPQKFFARAMRFHVEIDRYGDQPLGVAAWIGTNPIGVHRLGKVAWTPRTPKGRPTKGAKVGRKTYAGAWSWGRGKTGPAVMRRTSDARQPIQRVVENPHPAVEERLRRMVGDLGERYHRLLKQELNYALNFEGRSGVHRRLLRTEAPK